MKTCCTNYFHAEFSNAYMINLLRSLLSTENFQVNLFLGKLFIWEEVKLVNYFFLLFLNAE